MTDTRVAIFSKLDVPGVRAGLVGFSLLFVVMAGYSVWLGRTAAGALYLVAVAVLGAFLYSVMRRGKYSFGVWQAETAFFLVWIVSLRMVGGGFHHGLDASAVVVAVVAVTLGRGFARSAMVLVAVALPVVMKLFEAAWPSWFYFPVPIRQAKVGTGIELLSVAVIITVLLDRILAAYYLERRAAEDKAAALARAVLTDGMTGLANMTGIMERLDLEVETARREGRPLSVMMVDMDGLKALNDSQGHIAGDHALRAVAGVIRDISGGAPLAGRRGGDEFLVIFPGQDAALALQTGERVRAAVAALGIGCEDERITISAGVAELTDGGTSQMLDAADARLYLAKSAGRNAVVGSG